MHPSDVVLVAVLKAPSDLEIARVLGWYRIPVRSAPRTVEVDWLAFYQTARFGADRWAIHFAAPVRGHELATRQELLRSQPDHPRAQEQYFKLKLGPLERLPRPVPSRNWRRITFLYTTGARLLAAAEINDLVIQSQERELLWQALRERGLSAERQYPTASGVEMDLALLCALGPLGINVGDASPDAAASDWRQLHFLPATVQNELGQVVDRIEKSVRELGGLAVPGD